MHINDMNALSMTDKHCCFSAWYHFNARK